LNIAIKVYAVLLAVVFGGLAVIYIAYQTGAFVTQETGMLIGTILQNQIPFICITAVAFSVLLVMILLDRRAQQPKATAYTPTGQTIGNKPATGYNPQPTQPKEYEPIGQTISSYTTNTPTVTEIKEAATTKASAVKEAVTNKASDVKEVIEKIVDSS
jgi:predicted lipid-binding transport protein (Tim44 family)